MIAIETSDITDRLVGITPAYLQTFLQRKLYGIEPSVQAGKVRDKRRLFSEADVFGIALAWMLFESGLRTEPIRRIMNVLAGTTKANARITAEKLLKSGAEYIVVLREPRKPKGRKEPEPKIYAVKKADVSDLVSAHPAANVLVVPIGAKFADIKKLLELLY